MDGFMMGFGIGMFVFLIIMFGFGVVALIYVLAQHNIFFTIVKEGTAKAILRFGRFQKVVMEYKGKTLDSNWNVKNEERSQWQRKLGLGGLRWVGIPFVNAVHTYRFKWTSYEQKEELVEPITKEENVDNIIVRDDVYYTLVKEAETKGMVPVDVVLLLTLRVVNPYKALFRIQHWLEAVQNRIKPSFRSFVAEKTFEELAKSKEKIEKELGSFLYSSKIDEFLRREYGIKLLAAEMVRIDPAGERGEMFIEAATKKWRADREKEETMTLADAEVERLGRVYDKITSYGDNGLFIRTIEGIENASKGGNLVIFPFGALNDIIKGWTGKGKGEL